MAVEKGDKIKLEYTAMLENGKVFDTTDGKEPLEFVVGKNRIIKEIDDAVIGMKPEEEKEIEVPNAYGPVKDSLQHTMGMGLVNKAGTKPKVGMQIKVQDPTGKTMKGIIIDVREKNILVDFNHPLAGRTVKFKLKVKEIL